eukprot:1152404-Pelagomonas_calceolata.AAC.1
MNCKQLAGKSAALSRRAASWGAGMTPMLSRTCRACSACRGLASLLLVAAVEEAVVLLLAKIAIAVIAIQFLHSNHLTAFLLSLTNANFTFATLAAAAVAAGTDHCCCCGCFCGNMQRQHT